MLLPVAFSRWLWPSLSLSLSLALGGCTTLPAPSGLAPVIAPPSIAASAATTAATTTTTLTAATPASLVTASAATSVRSTSLVVPTRAEAPNAVAQMLTYADRVRALPGNELGAEIARTSDLGDSAPAQMQLALALAHTRAPADLARALGLLQRVIASQASDALTLQPLARALAGRYQEQRRVEDDRDRQVQQLREVQRRNDQLNDRLEALRAIERSVTRPVPHSSGATPATANGIKAAP